MKTKILPRFTLTPLAVMCCLLTVPNVVLAQGQVAFIPIGSMYQYLANGSDQGTAWRSGTLVFCQLPKKSLYCRTALAPTECLLAMGRKR